jgi:hypothetical protein
MFGLRGNSPGAKLDPRWRFKWLSAIMKAVEQLNHARELSPIEDWPESHLVTLQDSLRPFVELNMKLEKLI